MKILGFAGSNSSQSINRKLVSYVSSYFGGHEVEILDLNDYEMPIYSMDRERDNGIPQLACDFAQKIDGSDLLIVSLAENNSAYSAAFKNIFDWVSRITSRKVFGGKPMFLMATSPGTRGGASVLEIAKARFPRSGADIIDTFSLPAFYENFDDAKGIVNLELRLQLESKIKLVKDYLLI
jgi:NAD(P)H-dependent FMN reductase